MLTLGIHKVCVGLISCHKTSEVTLCSYDRIPHISSVFPGLEIGLYIMSKYKCSYPGNV